MPLCPLCPGYCRAGRYTCTRPPAMPPGWPAICPPLWPRPATICPGARNRFSLFLYLPCHKTAARFWRHFEGRPRRDVNNLSSLLCTRAIYKVGGLLFALKVIYKFPGLFSWAFRHFLSYCTIKYCIVSQGVIKFFGTEPKSEPSRDFWIMGSFAIDESSSIFNILSFQFCMLCPC